MTITNLERVAICTEISNSLIVKPEAITDFICIVGDEVSLVDLYRIRKRFAKVMMEQKEHINRMN